MKLRRRTRPCLFDIQVNGFAGVDFQDPGITGEELRRACQALRRRRIHRILLTLTTDSIDSLERKFARVESLRHPRSARAGDRSGLSSRGTLHEPGRRLLRGPLRQCHAATEPAGVRAPAKRGRREYPPGHDRPGMAGQPALHRGGDRNRVVVSLGHTMPTPSRSSGRSGPEPAFAPIWATPAPPSSPGTMRIALADLNLDRL